MIVRGDIVFTKEKVVVFCDSEFWHGFNWETKKNDIKSNKEFWIPKIERNMQRDQEVTEKLTADGYIVLRFWGKQIEKDLDGCCQTIVKAIEERRQITGNYNDEIYSKTNYCN